MRKFLIGALMIIGGVYSSAIEYTRDNDEAFSIFLENKGNANATKGIGWNKYSFQSN